MPQLVGDDVVRLAKEIEKGRHFLAQSRKYLYVSVHFCIFLHIVLSFMSMRCIVTVSVAATSVLIKLVLVVFAVSDLFEGTGITAMS